MGNQRKPSWPRPVRPAKPGFPVDSLPPEVARMVRAVAKAEKITLSQAAIAALIAVSDATDPGATMLAGALDVDLPPLDFDFLVPDPADVPWSAGHTGRSSRRCPPRCGARPPPAGKPPRSPRAA